MSMTPEVQESTFSDGGSYTFNNEVVYLTMVVATSDPSSGVSLCKLMLPINRDHFEYPSFCDELLKQFLKNNGVPQTFLNGHDCDMVVNLSTMLCDSVLQRLEVPIDYFCMLVMVFRTRCCYNVVNTPFFFYAEQVPSSELVQGMACEGGEHSLPAGATTLQRFQVQDEEDNCVICLEEFNTSNDAARLPCSHVCHYNCILEWFVQSGTCPMCRFACSHAL